jgi:hypothetical protein
MRASRTREFNVGASKLTSSKRPTLVPIEDSLVRTLLKVTRYDMWRVIYELVSDPVVRAGLERLQSDVSMVATVPLHRVLDVVVWRRGRGD